MQEKRKNYCWE